MLHVQPYPIEVAGRRNPAPEELLEAPRNLYCPLYEGCLDHAVRSGWDGFACRECAYRTVGQPPTADDFAHSRRRDPFGGG